MNKRMQQEREEADKLLATWRGPDAQDARHRVYLRAIRDLTRQAGYPPTVQEIGDAVQRAKSTVYWVLIQMRTKKLITYKSGKERTFVLTDWGRKQIQEVA